MNLQPVIIIEKAYDFCTFLLNHWLYIPGAGPSDVVEPSSSADDRDPPRKPDKRRFNAMKHSHTSPSLYIIRIFFLKHNIFNSQFTVVFSPLFMEVILLRIIILDYKCYIYIDPYSHSMAMNKHCYVYVVHSLLLCK